MTISRPSEKFGITWAILFNFFFFRFLTDWIHLPLDYQLIQFFFSLSQNGRYSSEFNYLIFFFFHKCQVNKLKKQNRRSHEHNESESIIYDKIYINMISHFYSPIVKTCLDQQILCVVRADILQSGGYGITWKEVI